MNPKSADPTKQHTFNFLSKLSFYCRFSILKTPSLQKLTRKWLQIANSSFFPHEKLVLKESKFLFDHFPKKNDARTSSRVQKKIPLINSLQEVAEESSEEN